MAPDRGLSDPRQFSIRWLAGTFLTGLAGTALMGGALFAAVDGRVQLSRDPSMAARNAAEGPAAARGPERRGDRLPPLIVQQQTRRIVQIATATRMDDREIVRTRPYARVQAQLALQRTSLTASIPAFNPLRLFNEAGSTSIRLQPPPQDGDGEMTVSVRPIGDVIGQFAEEDRLGPEQALALVRQAASVEATASAANPGTGTPPPRALTPADLLAAATTLGYGPAQGRGLGIDTPFRVFNENVTEVEKSRAAQAAAAARAPANDESTHIVQRGDTLATILVGYGASLEESRTIIEALSRRFRPGELREGHRVRVLLIPSEGDPARRSISRVAVLLDRAVLATAVLTETGQFVGADMSIEALDDASSLQADEAEAAEEESAGATPSLYIAIYETALRNGVPRRVADELIRIYSADVDFQRRVRPGDTLDLFYAAQEETGGASGREDILFTALTVGGETRRQYRFRTDDDNALEFYDEHGRSAQRFLMRTPIVGAVFRSGFGLRRHPILGYARMHAGVDWAGPFGTPIVAAGAGRVIRAEWVNGYGRRVELQHANGYVTTYNHMNGFGRGMERGARVAQGQVVGFLGSSGLSTGPHLHYEVLVNGSLVDPMRIRVPRGRVLDGRMLAEFERERLGIEQMMRRAGGAQLARSTSAN